MHLCACLAAFEVHSKYMLLCVNCLQKAGNSVPSIANNRSSRSPKSVLPKTKKSTSTMAKIQSITNSSSSKSPKIVLPKTEKSSRTIQKKLPYECRVCDESFGLESQLTDHLYDHIESAPKLESIEINNVIAVKLFDCDWCYEQYESATEMSKHLMLHGDHRPFVCDCGQRLATADRLAKHKLIHLKGGRRCQKSGNMADTT